jgi:hypothetical protein
MSIDVFLQFLMAHNQAVVNWLFVIVLSLSAIVALLTLIGRKEEGHASGISAQELEGAFRKVIEEKIPKGANLGTAAATAAGGAVSEQEDLVPAQMAQTLQLELEKKKAELVKVQSEMAAKDKNIEELKTSLAGTAAAAASGAATSAAGTATAGATGATGAAEDAALQARIEELEAKLAEYSIIEDDIADLCLYKEENVRLKEEVERLKTSPADSSAETITVPGDAPVAPSESVAVSDEQAAVVPEPEIVTPPVETGLNDAELEKAFMDAAAVAVQQFEATTPKKILPDAPSEPSEPLTVEVAASEAAPSEPSVEAAAALEQDLDTEKMMAEMAHLNDVPASDEDIGHILNEAGDTEKMAAEAVALKDPTKGS